MRLADTWTSRTALAAALALVLISVGCSDSPMQPGGATRPLLFEYFIFPRTVAPGSPAVVRAGAFVGPDLCWEIGSAAIRQSGDTLRLEGTGVYAPRGGACPQALAYDTLQVTLPALPAGRYLLVAGDLADTLDVTTIERAGPIPVGPRFAAHARIITSLIPEQCSVLECRYAAFTAISGYLENPPPGQPLGVEGRATGDFVGQSPCFNDPVRQRLYLRTFEPGPSNGTTRALQVEYLLHKGWLEANRAGEIEAGVYVGPDGCWSVLRAGVVQRGDSLLVGGDALYDVPPGTGCPDVLLYEVIRVTVPSLQAGRYILTDGVGLADTLQVGGAAPGGTNDRFVSYGRLCPSIGVSARCPAPDFICRYPGFTRVEGDIVGGSPAFSCISVVLGGTIVERVTCESIMRNRIQLRHFQMFEGSRAAGR